MLLMLPSARALFDLTAIWCGKRPRGQVGPRGGGYRHPECLGSLGSSLASRGMQLLATDVDARGQVRAAVFVQSRAWQVAMPTRPRTGFSKTTSPSTR